MTERNREAEYSRMAESASAKLTDLQRREFERQRAVGATNVAPGSPGYEDLVRRYGAECVSRLFYP